MPGELTRKAVFAQPEWLRGVPERVGDRRLPQGRVVFTCCGTSFHAAQTAGEAVQALEAVLSPPVADLLVVVSHEGGTSMALEAVKAFSGPTWLVTGKEESPLAEDCDEVIVVTPEVEKNGCGSVDFARLARSIDQIGISFKFTNRPRPPEIFTEEYLPARAERLIK